MDLVRKPRTIYWNRMWREIENGEGYWQINGEDYSDYFLQKYLDDSFKSEFMKVVFEKDPLTEVEKKGILTFLYLDSLLEEESGILSAVCLLLAAGADVNSRYNSDSFDVSPLHYLSKGKRKKHMQMMDILLTHPNIQVNVKDKNQPKATSCSGEDVEHQEQRWGSAYHSTPQTRPGGSGQRSAGISQDRSGCSRLLWEKIGNHCKVVNPFK